MPGTTHLFYKCLLLNCYNYDYQLERVFSHIFRKGEKEQKRIFFILRGNKYLKKQDTGKDEGKEKLWKKDLSFFKDTKKVPISWFTPQMPTTLRAGHAKVRKLGYSTKVSDMGAKNPGTWAITYSSNGIH